MRLLHRDTLATAHGAVAVGFTEPLPVVPDVRAARTSVLADLDAETGRTSFVMHQVHGRGVHVVTADAVPDEPVLEVDALVTARDDVALLARAADCVPLLLASTGGAVAAVHAGRRGMALGVVGEAVERLRALGDGEVTAWVGPHICGRCYEVPATLQDEVAAVVPQSLATTSWGTPALDLGAGVRAQLDAAGVADVREVGACTREDARWPSYRRDGDASLRFAGVVWRAS